jgi:bifunctional DNase/RNase
MLPENLLEVTISDVSITNVGFAIFLKPQESDSNKVVPIFIGPLETYSISSALDGVTPPRPNTHDLIVNMLQEMEARILHIIINDIIGSIFYARIVIQTSEGVVELDARPSDSVAVAIRTRCPMYMHEKVYREAAVVIGEESGAAEPAPKEEDDEEQQAAELLLTEPRSELEQLKQELQKAVEDENFERAAMLRDKIKQMLQEN